MDLTYFRVGIDDDAMEVVLALAVAEKEPPALVLQRLLRAAIYEDPEIHSERKIDVQGPRLN